MKNKYLKIRIEENQKQKIDKFCLKNSISISKFVRELIEKKDLEEIKIITNKEKLILYSLASEVKKVGVSINQIAHYFNLKHLKALDSPKSLQDLFLIDDLTNQQLENIKKNLEMLSNQSDKIVNNIKEIYDN